MYQQSETVKIIGDAPKRLETSSTKMKNVPAQCIKLGIRGYQKILNPMLRAVSGPYGGCRFSPSCSHYFYQAVDTHGALRGSWFGIRRLCRCHPWGGCGCDPVPPKKSSQ